MTLQFQYVCNLAVVAWPVAAWSDAPTIAREAQQGRLAEPRKNGLMQYLPASAKSCLQFNNISISFS